MRTVLSADGTKIAFDQTGQGPPVILVVGAFNDRSAGAPLAKALESRFTVLNYDRRGRGASGDTQPYAVEREVEDLDALIREAGGAARVFGYSSGATLALTGAARGLNITKLALYDAPFMVGDGVPRPPKEMAAQLANLVWAQLLAGRKTLEPNCCRASLATTRTSKEAPRKPCTTPCAGTCWRRMAPSARDAAQRRHLLDCRLRRHGRANDAGNEQPRADRGRQPGRDI